MLEQAGWNIPAFKLYDKLFRGENMEYGIFKDKLKKELCKYNINLNSKIMAIIFKVLNELNIIDWI